MPTNNRTFYPLLEVSLGPYCSASGTAIHGAQSASLNTTFNLEQISELGQIEIYAQIENLPNVELTINKDLDGYPLIYHLATPNPADSTLNVRTNIRCDGFLSLFSDNQNSASGLPISQVYCSGLYINSLNYSLNTNGAATESITLVGNDKLWKTSGFYFNGHFNNNDSPATGIIRRQDVVMGAATTGSVWPTVIPGITVSNGSGYNVLTGDVFGSHIQGVTISTNLNREDLLELGRRRPYYRYATFPVAVDTTINIVSTKGDAINATGDADNVSNEPIVIKLSDGTVFNMGNKNKLSSVSLSGGDTSGGVQTVAYSFRNFNRCTILNPNTDPASFTS